MKKATQASTQSDTDGAPTRALRAIQRSPTTATIFMAMTSHKPSALMKVDWSGFVHRCGPMTSVSRYCFSSASALLPAGSDDFEIAAASAVPPLRHDGARPACAVAAPSSEHRTSIAIGPIGSPCGGSNRRRRRRTRARHGIPSPCRGTRRRDARGASSRISVDGPFDGIRSERTRDGHRANHLPPLCQVAGIEECRHHAFGRRLNDDRPLDSVRRAAINTAGTARRSVAERRHSGLPSRRRSLRRVHRRRSPRGTTGDRR